MIDTRFSQSNYGDPEVLQQYVRSLLSRQQALDLLESIHQQIHQVWGVMRRLLEGTGSAARAAKAVRVARAAQAAKAQETYRSLERRREECIAALQEAERSANSALQTMIAVQSQPCRPVRRKLKNVLSFQC